MDYNLLVHDQQKFFYNTNTPFKLILNVDDIEKWQIRQREKLLSKGMPTKWANIGIEYEDEYIVIIKDLVEFPSGRRNGYCRLYNRATLEKGAAGVVILPTINGKFILLHQFRHATRSWHLEIPRGFGEPNTSAENQARNEIMDEIGGIIDSIIPLGLFHNNTGLEGNEIYLFFANLVSIGVPSIDEGIDEIIQVSLSELEELISTEKITDGFTIAAYTRAKLKGLI